MENRPASVIPGLFALAAASTIAAGLVYFLKERRSGHDAAPGAEARDRSVEAAVPTRA